MTKMRGLMADAPVPTFAVPLRRLFSPRAGAVEGMRPDPGSRAICAKVAAVGLPIGALLLTAGASSLAQETKTPSQTEACAGDNGGLTLPPDFCATVFADNIGHARQLVVSPDGVVYVNTWSGRYYHN